MIPTIFESNAQRDEVFFTSQVAEKSFPDHLARKDLLLPNCCETDVIRHYVNLAKLNYGVDTGFYPLGSCTMKYNPKVNDWAARLPGFSGVHPLTNAHSVQGCLELMFNLNALLCEITGLAEFTLSPAAGAQGELVGVMIIKKYFESRGEKRTKIFIPDSAHGTNPASAALCGFDVVVIKSDAKGNTDLEDLKAKLDDTVAGIMITNPNTLGLFDEHITQVCKLMHDNGSLVYCDGANMNAMLGVVKPADFGIDMMHLNLHKTFSTPHGGGGPGAGPLGVVEHLRDFLPNPRVIKNNDVYSFMQPIDASIGQLRSFNSNFGVLVRAYTYILSLGSNGLRRVAETAVLNANYIRKKLAGEYAIAYDRVCQHEVVLSDKDFPNGITTNDIAKRLIDFGMHPPTVYFPLIVPGSLMIEPTETVNKVQLDHFCATMLRIKEEAQSVPEIVKNAPHTTVVKRVDAVAAARNPILRYSDNN